MEEASRPIEFSRHDLDRVIRRAAELQFEEDPDHGGTSDLDEDEILRIGSEVGIEPRFVRRAIGEVRADQLLPALPEDRGLIARVVGGSLVRAYRIVPGSLAQIESKLSEHLQVAETLSPVRRRGGHSFWEPDRGFVAELRRGVHWRGYRYELARASSLQLTVIPMEDGFVLVGMVANLRGTRAGHAIGWTVGIGLALAGAGLGLGWLAGFPLASIPAGLVGIGIGIRTARGLLRGTVARIGRALEGILDRLEVGEPLARKSIPPPHSRRPRRM